MEEHELHQVVAAPKKLVVRQELWCLSSSGSVGSFKAGN